MLPQPVLDDPGGVTRGVVQRQIQTTGGIDRLQGAEEGATPVGAWGRDLSSRAFHPHRTRHWQQMYVTFVQKQLLPLPGLHLGPGRDQRRHFALSLRIHAAHGSQTWGEPNASPDDAALAADSSLRAARQSACAQTREAVPDSSRSAPAPNRRAIGWLGYRRSDPPGLLAGLHSPPVTHIRLEWSGFLSRCRLALTCRLSYTSGAEQTAPVLSPRGSLCLLQLGYGKPTAPGIAEDDCRLRYSRYHLPLVRREHHSMDLSLWHRRATHRHPHRKWLPERGTLQWLSQP
jgi:hypothetical protein